MKSRYPGSGYRFAQALVLAAMGAVSPDRLGAAEWSIGGQVYGQIGYNDNIRLATDDETDSGLGIAAGSVNLRARDAALEVGLDGEADIYRYTDESDLDTDNQFLRGFVNGRTQRMDYGLEASFRRDSDIVDQFGASGRELDTERRETLAIAPSLSYLVTRRDRVFADAEYRERDYTSNNTTRLDYDIWSGSTGWQHQYTRRTRLGAQLYASYFDSARQESVFLTPQAFVGYDYAERLSLSFAAGPSFVWSDTQTGTPTGLRTDNDTATGYSLDATASYDATEITRIDAQLTRRLEPSGDDGEAAETTRFALSMTQRLAPRLRFLIEGAAQRRTGIGDDTRIEDRNDFTLSPGLLWQVGERTELRLSYRLRYREFDDGDDATSNAVLLRLSYDLPEYRASW